MKFKKVIIDGVEYYQKIEEDVVEVAAEEITVEDEADSAPEEAATAEAAEEPAAEVMENGAEEESAEAAAEAKSATEAAEAEEILDADEEEIEFIINRKQFTVSNENGNCEIEILARKNDNCLKNISVIDEVNVSELEEEDYYKMFVYFVKSGDTVWKIAKHFKVCPSDIISVNNLENPDKLEIGDRLYIAR